MRSPKPSTDSFLGALTVSDGPQTSTWTRVPLSDVIERHQEFSRDPTRDGLTRFLKVEHMDRGRLYLSRWGIVEDGELPPTFYNVFREGHVLFPSRNPHLRRTVWPDFDGICGEKTFVIKAREGLLQELVPFIMQSDVVVEHAVRMKVGSTNPHVRWRDIASFEIALPPLDEQRRVAEALQATEISLNRLSTAIPRARALVASAAEELCWKGNFSQARVGDIASVEWGSFRDGDWIESMDQSEEGIRLLQLADIGVRQFLNKSAKFITAETFDRLNCTEVLPGDLLIARMAEPTGRTCIVPSLQSRCITAVDCCIARISEQQHHRQ